MLIGRELDARLFTDLSQVSQQRLVTPTAQFFVRSGASELLPDSADWQIRIGRTGSIHINALRAAARHMGTHLLECAGNVSLTRFGLISAARWTGVPIEEVLDRAKVKAESSWMEISGFDEYASTSRTSVPGASWIFPLDVLKGTGAFLATGMNGESLTADHGAPVRLVVPGWYGCACIKWVNNLAYVTEDAPATSQMHEYAVRTLQRRSPETAMEFEAATIDHAAVPVRVEKWKTAGKLQYRVVGILWGGSQPIRALKIRFNPTEEFIPVPAFHQTTTDPWTVWSSMWSPRQPGRYTIRLAVVGPNARARKLELGLYDRLIGIDEV